jgi:hypothetical protein
LSRDGRKQQREDEEDEEEDDDDDEDGAFFIRYARAKWEREMSVYAYCV